MSSSSALPNLQAVDIWLKSPIGTAASQMAANGLHLFPCHGVTKELTCTCGNPACKSQGKHPYTQHGLLDATNDIVKLAEMFKYRTDLNLALATGEKSGLIIVDIDGGKKGFESLAALEADHDYLPNCPISITGNGQHLFFNLPKEKIKSRANALGDEYPGIDIRSTGGYIIVSPSMHVSGRQYSWMPEMAEETPDMPEWLIGLLKEKPKERAPLTHDYSQSRLSEWSTESVQSMLDCLLPDMPYDDWLNVGFALHEGGFSLSLWDSWSRNGQKYQSDDCEKRWQKFNPQSGITIGTLVDMARNNGWNPPAYERPLVSTSLVDELVEKIQYKKIKEIPVFKPEFDPLEIPGLIGDTVRYITETSIRPQPMLALLNVLSFCGSVFGRRYATPLDTRTNVYIVGIADTGAGKDHSRKVIGKIAKLAMLSNFLGGNAIRSDTGMVRGLSNNCCQLLMLDEFGKMLQALTDKNSSPHHKSIIRVLMDLYARSNAIYNHGDYADPTKNETIIINSPNLCIYGTTTEREYAKGLHRDAIESGELNRVIALRVDAVSPIRLKTIKELPDELIESWKKFSPSAGSVGVLLNSPDIAPEPITVEWGDCDDLQWEILSEQDSLGVDNQLTKALWNRRHENIIKIAMVFAIARDKNYPTFDKKDFEFAKEIVDNAIKYMCVLASEQMVESLHEGLYLEVLKYVRRYKDGVSRTNLVKRFRKLKKREMGDLLDSLEEQEDIVRTAITTKTKNIQWITATNKEK